MSERERWRKVRRADGYKVSSLGRVRSVDRALADGRLAGGVMLAQYPDRDGYLRVTIRGEPVAVHALVLEAFRGPRPYGTEACHDPLLSAGRQDCRASVLRWDTHRENERDKKRAERGESEGASPPFLTGTSETGELR